MRSRPLYHFGAFFVLSVAAIGVLRSGAVPDTRLFLWGLTIIQLLWGLFVFPAGSLRLGRISAAIVVLLAVQGLQYAFNVHQWRPEAFSALDLVNYFVFIALVEEIWFRGVLQQSVTRLGYLGIALGAVIFGLYHIHSGWTVVLTTAAVGSVYAVARHLGAGILSLALAHGAMNFANNVIFPPVGLRVEAAQFYITFPILCVVIAVLWLVLSRFYPRRAGR